MSIKTSKRQVGPLSMRGSVTSVNDERRTAEVVFSTGARVLRTNWFGEASYEELSMSAEHVRMDRLNSGAAPLLADHRGTLDNVIGVVESARIENGKGIATVRFAKAEDDPRADQIYRKVKDGVIRSVSIGYRTYRSEKVGEVEKVPVLRATSWEPYEVSAVAMPADAGAGFRGAEDLNECEFADQTQSTQEHRNMSDGTTPAAAPAAAPAPEKRSEQVADLAAEKNAVVKLERERVAGILAACKVAKLPELRAQKFIADGTEIGDVRAQILDELAKRSDEQHINTHAPAIEVGEEAREKAVRGMTAALLSRTGLMPALAAVAASVKTGKAHAPGVVESFRDFDGNEHGGEFRSFRIVDLARESLELRGVNTRRLSDKEIMARALSTRDGGGEATISDFAVVLENVMYKVLLGAYAQAADTWREFCGTDSVQDFRPANRYRTGSFGVLDLKPESAEYVQKSIPDGLKFAITTQTYGNKIAVSREALINDDMGAITDTMSKFGRAAGLSIEKAVFDLIAENSGMGPDITLGGVTAPLFDDTAWKNEGTGAALSVASLEADRVKMAQQKDISNNEYLNLRPSVLLVPLALEGEANLINTNRYDPTASTAFERANIVNGLFSRIVGSPRLSGVRRYLFVSPAEVAALKVVFLNGAQTPYMEQRLNWDVDGTQVKLRIDFKAQAFDPKGALTNKGST